MRRKHPPAVQAAWSRRASCVSPGVRCVGPGAEARRTSPDNESKRSWKTEKETGSKPPPHNSKTSIAVDRSRPQEDRDLKSSSTGGLAEQTYKHRARSAGEPATSW